MAFVLLLAQTLLVSARADNIDCPVLSEQAVDLEDVYDRYNVTKEVLKAVPDTFLAVRYNDTCVFPGDTISPATVLFAPDVAWECDATINYTLIMVDPDFPNPDPTKQYLHWLVDSIPDCDVSKGTTKVFYQFPTPLPATGPHRYCLYLFRSEQLISNSVTQTTVELLRVTFSTKNFANIYGDPVAGNFYVSKSVVLGDDKVIKVL